ncbi:MAG: P1 family peptidase, partial [Candidatus Krumholzibacteriota bacterium]|nr:P1 family peptidase [Candidatus Krumholzibacteriota bacterium]
DGIERDPGMRRPEGSIMIILATDAPLSSRNLRRLAARAIMGLSRTGSAAGNGSGDYVIAFSTHKAVRRPRGLAGYETYDLANAEMTNLFQATVEATEEAIYNSIFMATTVSSNGNTVRAVPLDEVRSILARYGVPGR